LNGGSDDNNLLGSEARSKKKREPCSPREWKRRGGNGGFCMAGRHFFLGREKETENPNGEKGPSTIKESLGGKI